MLTAVDDADAALLNKSMPVGPVAGGVMGCFVLLALAVYCYRCYSRRRSRHCDGSLPGDAHLHDSTVDFEDLDAKDGILSHIHSILGVHMMTHCFLLLVEECKLLCKEALAQQFTYWSLRMSVACVF